MGVWEADRSWRPDLEKPANNITVGDLSSCAIRARSSTSIGLVQSIIYFGNSSIGLPVSVDAKNPPLR